MKRALCLAFLFVACTLKGSGKHQSPTFARWSTEVPLFVQGSSGSSEIVSASVTEVSTVLGLDSCYLNVWWQSGESAKLRVADTSSRPRQVSVDKIADSTVRGASHKSQTMLDSYSCRRPVTVLFMGRETELVRR